MGRRPAIRVSFINDVRFLYNFADALSRDERLSQKDRDRLIGKVKDLAADLVNVDSE